MDKPTTPEKIMDFWFERVLIAPFNIAQGRNAFIRMVAVGLIVPWLILVLIPMIVILAVCVPWMMFLDLGEPHDHL